MKMLYLAVVYVHVVTTAVWVGAMLFEDPASNRFMCRMADKIRGIGGPSLLILLLTGAFLLSYRGTTWEDLATGRLLAEPYGKVMAAKFVLVVLLIACQIMVGNKPSKVLYVYLLLVLSVIALSVCLVRPIM